MGIVMAAGARQDSQKARRAADQTGKSWRASKAGTVVQALASIMALASASSSSLAENATLSAQFVYHVRVGDQID